jgi:hypothetical protein
LQTLSSQSPATTHALPSAQGGQLEPPQSTSVSVPSLTPSVHEGAMPPVPPAPELELELDDVDALLDEPDGALVDDPPTPPELADDALDGADPAWPPAPVDGEPLPVEPPPHAATDSAHDAAIATRRARGQRISPSSSFLCRRVDAPRPPAEDGASLGDGGTRARETREARTMPTRCPRDYDAPHGEG